LSGLLAALEGSYPANLLRTSFVLYPVINAAHILAIGVLITATLLMDLRLLGIGRAVDAETVIRSLRPFAVGGLLFALGTGLLLFSVRPFDYLANAAFQIKMALLLVAAINALLFTVRKTHRRHGIALRLGVAVSLLLWPAVLLAGRFIGFLE